MDCPLANRLFPGSLGAPGHVRGWGETVILSDGDVVFRPRKGQRSGLRKAVEGRVPIYIHKGQKLDDVEAGYPVRHYVMRMDAIAPKWPMPAMTPRAG